MKCFYHPDRDAVAVCSVCGKPLCKECAKEYNGKIVCPDCLEKIKKEKEEKKGNTIGNMRALVLTFIIISIIIAGFLIARSILKTPLNPRSVFQIPGINMPIFGGNDNYGVTGRVYSMPITTEKSLSINIEIDTAALHIYPTSDSILYKVEPEDCTPSVEYTKNNQAGELKIVLKKLYYRPFESGVVNLYVNDSVSINLTIKLGTGDMKLDEGKFQFSRFVVKSGTGDIEMAENNSFDVMNIKSGTGDVMIGGNNSFDTVSINTGTGDITIGGVTRCNTVAIKSGVGNCKLDITKIKDGSDIDIKTGMGDVNIRTGSNTPVKAKITALHIRTSGFEKEDNYYINKKYREIQINLVNIDVSSAGDVSLGGG